MKAVKSENQIRKRLRQLQYRAFQKKARSELKIVPANCAFNRTTSTIFPDGRPFRVCGLALDAEPREFFGCNETTDASRCGTFLHRTDKKAVKETVEREMADSEAGPRDYPMIAALMWVLDEEMAEIEPETTVRWWQFWRRWYHRRLQ